MADAIGAPERIHDRIHHRRAGADRAGLPRPLHPERVVAAAHITRLEVKRRHVTRPRQCVVQQARAQELAGIGVVDRVFHQSLTDALHGTAMDLAGSITGALTDSGEKVWGLITLPRADRIPQSVRYYKINAMGLEFMRNTYTAEYRKEDTVITAFISRHSTPAAAEDTVARFNGYVKNFGDSIKAEEIGGVKLIVCDMGGIFDVAFTKGRLAGGVSSVEDRDLAVKSAVELWRQLPDDK